MKIQLKRDTKIKQIINQHENEKYLLIPKAKKIYVNVTRCAIWFQSFFSVCMIIRKHTNVY